MQETWARSLGQEDPLENEWQPAPVFSPGEFCGWRNLVGYNPWGCKESDMTEWLTLSLSGQDLEAREVLFVKRWMLYVCSVGHRSTSKPSPRIWNFHLWSCFRNIVRQIDNIRIFLCGLCLTIHTSCVYGHSFLLFSIPFIHNIMFNYFKLDVLLSDYFYLW